MTLVRHEHSTGTDTPAEPENPDLPEGFAEESGEFYVPPELREYYRADEVAELKALYGSGRRLVRGDGAGPLDGVPPGPLLIARQRAVDEQYAAMRSAETDAHTLRTFYPEEAGADPSWRRQTVLRLSPRWNEPDTFQPADLALWKHGQRLSRAAQAAEQIKSRAEAEVKYKREHTCVACRRVLGEVERRDVHGAKLLCCRGCGIVLAAAAVQQLALEVIGPDGAQRGELVKSYLDEMRAR